MISRDSRTFALSLPSFKGHIDELAMLVAQKKLAVEDLPLSQMAAQLASHVHGEAYLDLDEVGTLMSVTAGLLLSKSARLLVQPMPAEEEDVTPFGSQRITDRIVFAHAAAILADREGLESFAPLAIPNLVERPVQPRSPAMLARAWADMQQRAASGRVRVAVPAFVRLETAVSRLIRRLRSHGWVSFASLLRGSNRQDAVVHFIAVLELVRQRQASVVQAMPYEDIRIEYTGRVADEASRVG
jgi:segregation and condensation protein A